MAMQFSSSAPTNWKRVAVFAVAGTVGPLLILVLKRLNFNDVAYRYLYELIAVICPAWSLGVYEYTVGPTVAGWIVLIGNILVWFLLGLALSGFGRTKTKTVIAIGSTALMCSYVFWALRSITSTIGLFLVIILLVIATNIKQRESK
jgi:hypothetical protein